MQNKVTMKMKRRRKVRVRKKRRKRRVSVFGFNFNLSNQTFCVILEKKNKAPKEYGPREQDNSHIRVLGSWSPGDWK